MPALRTAVRRLRRTLGDDANPQALRLRADLLWEQANWPAAAVVLAQLVPEKPREDRLLTDDESRNVADLAVALTLAGDEDAHPIGVIIADATRESPRRRRKLGTGGG